MDSLQLLLGKIKGDVHVSRTAEGRDRLQGAFRRAGPAMRLSFHTALRLRALHNDPPEPPFVPGSGLSNISLLRDCSS